MPMSLLSPPPYSPYPGLPSSPRQFRQIPSPAYTEASPSPSPTCDKAAEPVFVDTRLRRRDSLIFVNATIPLSAPTTVAKDSEAGTLDGLAPRKKSGLARLFSCFGRQERARRRAMMDVEYEKVGEDCHWSEY